MLLLAIESSCDETSIAVIKDSSVLSNIISSQLFHAKYGGVIPELASRAHIQNISGILSDSLMKAKVNISDVEAIAVTTQPGLAGSLIVGSNFAKGLALKYNLPIIPVNHIEGHLYSGCLQDSSLTFPFIALVVSGGHTALFYVTSYNEYEILGLTLDDAAGEAFDKTAKLIGLQYPGGPLIDKYAKTGNPSAYNFPRSMISSHDYNFSFSGLKTSVRYFLAREFPDGLPESLLPDFCASVQEAIVDVLVKKSIKAAEEYSCNSIIIAGGVSANSRLRDKMTEFATKKKIRTVLPDMDYCMDNAAMIGFIAEKKYSELDNSHHRNFTFTVNATALRAGKRN